MLMKDISCGDIVADRITGFRGVVVARTEWLNGCVRVTVQPQELREGKPIESQGFDVEQMEVVGARVVLPRRDTGGDRAEIVRAADPTR